MLIPTIEKILNISSHELPRTGYVWLIKLLNKMGFIIGWTTMTAMFVTHFSISSLPILFLIQATLTMIGMFMFSYLNDRVAMKTLIAISALIIALLVFGATLVTQNELLFFGLIFAALGIFTPQLGILISSYIENFFSPLECERTTPLIESAETIGGVFAGFMILALSLFVPSYKMLYVWILFIFLMMSVFLFLEPIKSTYVHLFAHQKKKTLTPISQFKKIKKGLQEIHAVPFLQGLFLVFLIQWVIGHLLEFQYTKVIDATINHGISNELHEESLTSGLGSFQIIFSGSALLIQLLLASRLLKILGTVGGFVLHSLITLLSSISLLLGFGYFTAILAKNNFEISGIINRNAYENSYYALKHGTQRTVREFFEAFIYPLGTIIGTLLLLGIQFFFLEQHALPVIQFLLVFLAIFMVGVSFQLRNHYTKLAQNNLLQENNILSKLNAIEILSQKGHDQTVNILVKALRNPHEKNEIKLKIMAILGKIGHQETIPEIVSFLHNHNPQLVLAAVSALGNFPKLDQHVFNQAFSYYRLIHELKELFIKTSDKTIQIAIIKALAHLNYEHTVSFLLKGLETGSTELKIACIQICGLSQDPNVAHFIEPYLKAANPFIKAETVASLWQFKKYRHRLRSILNCMLNSSKREDLLASASIIGDIGNKNDKKQLIPHLTIIDPELRLYASYSLLKLGYKEASLYLVNLMLSKNPKILSKARELFHSLKGELQEFIANTLQKEAAKRLHHLFTNKKELDIILEAADTALLERLKNAYLCIESYQEADYIDDILEKRTESTISTSLLVAKQPIINY